MIVIAHGYGQLCNRLTVFANFIGWSVKYGVTIANPAFTQYAQYFEGTAKDPWCRYPPRETFYRNPEKLGAALYKYTKLITKFGNRFGINNHLVGFIDIKDNERFELDQVDNVRGLCSRKLTFVKGWEYRDEIGLHRNADAIRPYFTPKPVHIQQVEKTITSARATADILVGVHIRAGDYRTWAGGQFFYSTAVYSRILSRLRSLHKDKEVAFLLCSNEPIDPDEYRDFNAHYSTSHLIEDLYALARCDLLIGPPSTYSQWASYFGNVPLLHICEAGIDPALENFNVAWTDPRIL
jgi:hypothetical protein